MGGFSTLLSSQHDQQQTRTIEITCGKQTTAHTDSSRTAKASQGPSTTNDCQQNQTKTKRGRQSGKANAGRSYAKGNPRYGIQYAKRKVLCLVQSIVNNR